jgi:hypothetical protein
VPPNPPHPHNVDGPFYVENDCCLRCGVPEDLAPALFAKDHEGVCFVKRQPEPGAETDTMIRVLVSQDVGCIRYRGTDASIARRLGQAGQADQCDLAFPTDVARETRDHVSFGARGEWTPRTLLERFARWFADESPRWKTTKVTADKDAASVSVCWFEDRFHRVDATAAPSAGWLVRHHVGAGLSYVLHDWLTGDATFHDIRWYTAEEWVTRARWLPTPC